MDIALLRTALLNPQIYPDRPHRIEFKETHISLLFFTENHVYKVKKPVDFGFLDFTSLEKRKFFCEREVVLNRRLSPAIYLGVVPITKEGSRILLEGKGEAVEYAVKMKRIPEEKLMDRLLEKGQVTPGMIGALSETLVKFYSAAETSDLIKSFAKPDRVKQDTDENFEQTEKYIDVTLSREIYEEVRGKTNEFLRTKREIFLERITSDRIRDCHGDLRLEHIFWGDEISVLDCIEFNERFRYTDVAADIAFLAMDLDLHGEEGLSEHLIRAHVKESRDAELREVLNFYKCYRAYIRGKVESFRLEDPHLLKGEKDEVLKRAEKYFSLAHRYALRFQ